MKVLAIDTSNQVMSIAVLEDKKIIGETTTNMKRNHSERLMPAIQYLLQEVGWQPSDLDRIAVAKGPGSYTGLRIGVTTAKTLAWTLNKELVGVSSLKTVAANREGASHYLVPLFDARRNNIYTGLYQWENDKLTQIESDTHIAAEKWLNFLQQKEGFFEFVGEDAAMYTELFERYLPGRTVLAPFQDRLPRAGVLGLLSLQSLPEDIHTFVPDYLKLAEAEENWRAQHPDHLEDSYVEKI